MELSLDASATLSHQGLPLEPLGQLGGRDCWKYSAYVMNPGLIRVMQWPMVGCLFWDICQCVVSESCWGIQALLLSSFLPLLQSWYSDCPCDPEPALLIWPPFCFASLLGTPGVGRVHGQVLPDDLAWGDARDFPGSISAFCTCCGSGAQPPRP